MPELINKKQRVLLIRFSSIGDIVLTTPLIRAIKQSNPDITLDYLTSAEFSILLKDNPFIDNLFIIERGKGIFYIIKKALLLREFKYNHIFDLHRSTRSLIFRLLLKSKNKFKFKKNYIRRFLLTTYNLNLYKRPYTVVERYFNTAKILNITADLDTEIWLRLDEIQNAIIKINKIASTNYSFNPDIKDAEVRIENGIAKKDRYKVISLMPFAKWKTKEWGDDRFIELGRKLKEDIDVLIWIFGGKDDMGRAGQIAERIGNNSVSFSGELSLAETATALSLSDCLVSNDTGIMHIGGAVSIPVIAIFGCTAEELGFSPYKTEGELVQIPLYCRPCTAKGLAECPKRHFRCMNDISVDMVYTAVKKYI